MNKFLITAVLLAFSSISTASAQRAPVGWEEMPVVVLAPAPDRIPGEFDEVQYWLDKNDKAHFEGVIVNPEGWAYIISEYEALEKRSQAAIDAQRAEDLAFINLELGKLVVEMNAQQQKAEIQIAAREDDHRRCQEINQAIVQDSKSLKKKVFIGVGSGAIGAVVGVIVGMFAL